RRTRRVIESQRGQRVQHAVAPGDASERSLHAQDAQHSGREGCVLDAGETLAVLNAERDAFTNALLVEETLAVFMPWRDALGGPADGVQDRLLGLGLLQQGAYLSPIEVMF